MGSYDLDKGQHSVYSLYYHFIQVVKYGKKVFINNAMVDFLKMKIREISETFNVDVLDIECDKDYFNMIFKATPLLNITKYINAVKNELYNGKFWSPSYFLATSGQVTLDVLKRYVDSHGDNKEGIEIQALSK